MRDVEQKWLGVFALEKLCRVIGKNVCDVAGNLFARAVVVDFGIEIDALAFDADPVINAWAWIVVEAHVPFADESGFVAGVVKQLWKSNQLVALRIARRIVDDPVLVRVLAGEKAGPAR